ncbi:MAG: hypothetical protein Q4P28_03795 [Tissierellia bacterium]|nr:hypothetical protein [Tissierellia bacterium]
MKKERICEIKKWDESLSRNEELNLSAIKRGTVCSWRLENVEITMEDLDRMIETGPNNPKEEQILSYYHAMVSIHQGKYESSKDLFSDFGEVAPPSFQRKEPLIDIPKNVQQYYQKTKNGPMARLWMEYLLKEADFNFICTISPETIYAQNPDNYKEIMNHGDFIEYFLQAVIGAKQLVELLSIEHHL